MMKKFQYTIMDNGMIYVEALTFHLQGKLARLLNLLRYQAHTGEEIQTMKCYKEYMEHVGGIKKN